MNSIPYPYFFTLDLDYYAFISKNKIKLIYLDIGKSRPFIDIQTPSLSHHKKYQDNSLKPGGCYQLIRSLQLPKL